MSAIASDTDEIRIEQRGSALFATLNRPQARNALTADMVRALSALCDALKGRRDIRAVVLRGAGGAFCAGGDVKEFARQLLAPPPEPGAVDPIAVANRTFGDLLLKMDGLDQALIVVVEGAAFGGANGFMAVGDIVLCEAGARLSLSETTLGVAPAQIAPFLARRIGAFATRRLALSGAHFGAEEALRVGLCDRVLVGAEALDEALREALNLVGRCEAEANAATKRIISACGPAVDPAALDAAADAFARCLRGAGREGAMAFAAKAPPPWVETFEDLPKP